MLMISSWSPWSVYVEETLCIERKKEEELQEIIEESWE